MMKQFFCWLLLPCLALFGVTIQQFAFATSNIIVQGKIMQMDGSQPGSMTVQLMEISMSDRPTIRPVHSVQSDPAGNYTIHYSPNMAVNVKVFYRISVDFAGQKIGSDPFLPNKTKEPITINISLPVVETTITSPVVETGSQHLTIPKEVVIVESMEEKIRITNVLFVVNRTTALIDAKKSPFEKPIPNSAINIQPLGSPEGVEFEVQPGKVLIGVTAPEGTKQVFFSYEILVSGQGIDLDYPLMAGIEEIELATPEKSMTLAIDEQVEGEYSLVSQTKKMGGRIFYSKILSLQSARNSIPILISGIPLSQSRLLLPAFVLFAVLIIGLAAYLVRNKSLQPA